MRRGGVSFCRALSVAISASPRVEGSSGWRRTVPVAEHGASNNTRSNVSSAQVRASAVTRRAVKPVRFRLASTRLIRGTELSSAVDVPTGGGQLHGLTARRGAQIQHLAVGRRRHARWQGGCSILHPPFASLVTFQRGDSAGSGQANLIRWE